MDAGAFQDHRRLHPPGHPILGNLLKSFDIREITEDAGLKFLGRRVD